MAVDKGRLLAELGKWRGHRDLLVSSVAEGLAARVRRGDFDMPTGRTEQTGKDGEDNGS